MGAFQPPVEQAFYGTAGVSTEDDAAFLDTSVRQQAIDTEFLDAVCNGVLLVGRDFRINSQNYISRVHMGDLVGRCCYEALENRTAPCDNCPRQGLTGNEYETAMRCAGKACSLYEVRLYPSEKGPEVVEVYPNMIDREIVVKNLHLYREELDLLNSVVENIRNAIADDTCRV
ncbi:MAG: hypothetical protein A4E28_00858 [Methanocella sp. PtaU1.Bin125]|nr:MAG: hypothetical protein A4E28_00858 [Methanocella sp. PtaU1.Bin125]